MNKQMKNGLIKAFALLVLIALFYCMWCYFLTDEVIWEKVTVNGISLYGMTREEAEDALEKDFEEKYQDTYMTIRLNGEEYKLNIYPVLGIEAEDMVKDAYSLGHGPWYTHGTDRIELMNTKTKEEVTLMPTAQHQELLDGLFLEAGLLEASTTVETTWEETDTSLVITKGKTGLSADTKALKQEILDAIDREEYTAKLDCPMAETQPRELALADCYRAIHKVAQNAYLDDNHEVVPAVMGVSFDVAKAQQKFDEAKEGETVVIDLTYIEPAVSTAQVESLPYLDLLGSYTTYGGGTENRITNLKLAVAGCDGVELQPGEIFSYNDALGPRTAERGYKNATVIVNGEYEQGIGGGICQVSTTLFMACLYSDLDIVERHNHSARVDYVEDGLDAAVVWGGQDFKFQNNTGHPVKISAVYEDESVTVQIYGTKETENQVEITTEHSDANTCTTYRSVYDRSGNLLETEQVAYSQYKE